MNFRQIAFIQRLAKQLSVLPLPTNFPTISDKVWDKDSIVNESAAIAAEISEDSQES